MSVHVTSPVWKLQGLTLAEKLVLLKLADCSNDGGESIFPAVSTIMRDTGVKESTVRQALSTFRKWGLILADGRHEKRRTVVYRMNMELLRNGFPEGHERVQPMEGPANGGSSQWTHIGPANGPNTSFNRQEERTPIIPLQENAPDDFTEDFEKLWATWTPFEMLHGDRPQAERKYAKIRSEGVGADEVMTAARVYCQQCRNTSCKTKHLENWLGQFVRVPKGKGLGEGTSGKGAGKKHAAADAEKTRALRYQPWHDAVKQHLGDAVYRSWIERLWLDGNIVYCSTRFRCDYVQQHYSRPIAASIGHEVRYQAEPPPPHAFADSALQPPTGEGHGQNEATA